MTLGIGRKIYKLVKKLFPINRSITGRGNRKTLSDIKKIIKNLKIKEYKSGQKVFDWKIPSEWNVNEAYVKLENKKIINFKNNNLHLISYSTNVNKYVNKKELLKHIHVHKKSSSAIPYKTSYYKKYWGFCKIDIQSCIVIIIYKYPYIYRGRAKFRPWCFDQK